MELNTHMYGPLALCAALHAVQPWWLWVRTCAHACGMCMMHWVGTRTWGTLRASAHMHMMCLWCIGRVHARAAMRAHMHTCTWRVTRARRAKKNAAIGPCIGPRLSIGVSSTKSLLSPMPHTHTPRIDYRLKRTQLPS